MKKVYKGNVDKDFFGHNCYNFSSHDNIKKSNKK